MPNRIISVVGVASVLVSFGATSASAAGVGANVDQILSANEGRLMGQVKTGPSDSDTCYVEVRHETNLIGQTSTYVEYYAGFSSDPQVIHLDLSAASGQWRQTVGQKSVRWVAPTNSGKPNLTFTYGGRGKEFKSVSADGSGKVCQDLR